MRLVLLSARLGTGGTRRYALELAPVLARLGHHVTLAAPDLAGERPEGVDVRTLPSARWPVVRTAIREFRPDAIRLITGAFPPDTRLGLPLWRARMPVMESVHVIPRRTGVGVLRSAFYRARGTSRYRCVVLSPGMESRVRSLCPAIAPALIGMTYGMVIPAPGVEPASPGVTRFITVTRLEEKQKAVGVLLRAFAAVASDVPASLTIVGDGPDRAALKRLSADLGIADRVVFTGWVDDPIRLMRDADVFVLSTNHESFGRVNIEAAAVGLPIIATDESGGGCRESVADGVNGILVPPGSVETLASAMRRLACDADLRTRLAQAGPSHAAAFSIDAHARETVRILESITRPA